MSDHIPSKNDLADEDAANIGRALMERLPPDYSWSDCPTEIVTDLQNEIHDLKREVETVDTLRKAALALVDKEQASRATPETSEQPTRERLLDLATELARYFTSGNPIAVERATVRRESDLYLLLRECMPNWQFEPLKTHELKATGCPTHGMEHFFEGMCIKCGVVPPVSEESAP